MKELEEALPDLSREIFAMRDGDAFITNVPVAAIHYGTGNFDFGSMEPGCLDFALNIAAAFVKDLGLDQSIRNILGRFDRGCRHGVVPILAWHVHHEIAVCIVSSMKGNPVRLPAAGIRQIILRVAHKENLAPLTGSRSKAVGAG